MKEKQIVSQASQNIEEIPGRYKESESENFYSSHDGEIFSKQSTSCIEPSDSKQVRQNEQ